LSPPRLYMCNILICSFLQWCSGEPQITIIYYKKYIIATVTSNPPQGVFICVIF
jgi:hypothetical protein